MKCKHSGLPIYGIRIHAQGWVKTGDEKSKEKLKLKLKLARTMSV
jgi:hypothetical protein